MQRLESKIRAIPDFPRSGVVFRDITPLVGDSAMLRLAVDQLVHPFVVQSVSYELEYGRATLEAHIDAINPGDRILLVDDLIATGGTASASCELVERLGGEIAACAFVIELDGLGGRGRLPDRRVHSLLHY